MNLRYKKIQKGYIVYRVDGEYRQHSHFASKSGAMKLIELINLRHKMPKNSYFVTAAKRILTDKEFKDLR